MIARATRIALVALVVVLGLSFWGFTVDDAFISLRYGWNLVHHGQLSFNLDRPPTLGFTNPSWTILLAPATLLPEAWTLGVAKVLGLAAAAALVGFVATPPTPGRLVGALLVATNLSVVAYSVAGLETTLFTLLAYGGARLWIERGEARRGAVLLALATCTRPEGVAVFAVALLFGARRLRALRTFLVPVGLLLLFELMYFESIVPLALFAKPSTLVEGFRYDTRFLLWATGLTLVPLLAVGIWRGGRLAWAAGAFVLAWLAIVLWEGGDWMPAHRLLAPAVPWISDLAARGVDWILERRRPDLTAAALLLAIVPVVFAADRLLDTRPEAVAVAATRRRTGRLADRLRRRFESVALVDVGYLSYRSRLRVLDLSGLTDPVIAHARGGHLDKEIDELHLGSFDPDAFVLHNRGPDVHARGSFAVELRLTAGHFLRNRYVYEGAFPAAPNYTYHLFVRRDRARWE